MKPQSIPWLRIATEFVVIFLGVSLSLAGDDWRQWREDRAAERELLVELMADLSADSADLSTMQRYMRRWDGAALDLAKIDSGLMQAPDSAILRRIERLMVFSLYQPVSSAYVGLKEGGQLPLIQDPELRREVVEYYEVRQPYMLQFDDLAQEAHDRFRLIVLRHVGFEITDSVDSFWPPPEPAFRTSWSAWMEEEGTRGALEHLGVLAGNWAVRIESVLAANADLRASIREELEAGETRRDSGDR